jgi:hypothetical protein
MIRRSRWAPKTARIKINSSFVPSCQGALILSLKADLGRHRSTIFLVKLEQMVRISCGYEYGEILDEGGADWEFPAALYPPQRDARLSAQRRFFTIHGTDLRPLDAISPELIAAIDLMPGAVSDAQEALEFGGFNEFSLLPDLEGLSRHLKKRYKIE